LNGEETELWKTAAGVLRDYHLRNKKWQRGRATHGQEIAHSYHWADEITAPNNGDVAPNAKGICHGAPDVNLETHRNLQGTV